MGKNRAEKRAAAAAAARGEAAPSKPAKSQWARYAALVALAAVGVQACIYFALSDREPDGGASNSTRPARRAADAEPAVPLHPPVCPPDWKRCPQLPGVDWPALLAAVPAPSELDADALAKCGATALLSPRDIKGMHVMCVLPPTPELAASTSALIAAYRSMRRRDGADDEPTPPTVVVPVPSRLSKEAHLVATIEYALRTPPKLSAKHQPAALFSKSGVRVRTVAGGFRQRALLLMEGGQWLWPPVDVGHVHIIADLTAPGVETRVVTASLRPLVLEVENFLSPTEVSRARPPRTCHCSCSASRHGLRRATWCHALSRTWPSLASRSRTPTRARRRRSARTPRPAALTSSFMPRSIECSGVPHVEPVLPTDVR